MLIIGLPYRSMSNLSKSQRSDYGSLKMKFGIDTGMPQLKLGVKSYNYQYIKQMKHTDYYKQAREIKEKSIRELAAALKAHGGSYTWKNPDADNDDDEIEESDNIPCIGFNLDSGPVDVIVYQASVNEDGGVTIVGRYNDDSGDIAEFDPYDAFVAHLDFLMDEIPETEEVSDVSLPQEFFEIASVSREDLEAKGYDTSNVTDAQMRQVARRLGDAYVENGFWIDLEIIADHLEIPKKIDDDEEEDV